MCNLSGNITIDGKFTSKVQNLLRTAFIVDSAVKFPSPDRMLVAVKVSMSTINRGLRRIAEITEQNGLQIRPETRLVLVDDANVITVVGYNGKWTWSTIEEDVLARAATIDLAVALAKRPEFAGIDPLKILGALKDCMKN